MKYYEKGFDDWPETTRYKGFDECSTIEELYESTEAVLDYDPGGSNFFFPEAQRCAIRLRKLNPKSTTVPRTGDLTDILQWCIDNQRQIKAEVAKATERQRQIEFVSKQELLQFVSIYQRFKQVIKGHGQNLIDFHYEQTRLADDIQDFWPVIERIAHLLDISLQSNLRLVKKLIFGDTVTVAAGGKKVTIIRPEGDLDSFMICGFMHTGENFIYSAMQQLHWPERDLDRIKAKLCDYFGINEKDFTPEGIAKCEPCTREEFLRIKSIHKGLNFLIEHKSKKTDPVYSHRQMEVFQEIKNFWPRLNQISRLLNVPLEIGLEGFNVAIFGSESLNKTDADLICYRQPYNELPMDDVLAIEEARLESIAQENLDEIMANLRKYFGINGKIRTKSSPDESAVAKQKIEPGNKSWKSPKGYIGSKTIVNDYDIPRSTLEGWQQQDNVPVGELEGKIKKDPQTQECYFPKKWFNKRLKNYRPRNHKT